MSPLHRVRLPRLHIVSDDAVLASASFVEDAGAILSRFGADVALHLRGHGTSVSTLYGIAEALVAEARLSGAMLLINDRIDIALAVVADGVQLGRRSLPVAEARKLLRERLIGYSAHDADEAHAAWRAGTDFVILGTIYPSASHPQAHAVGAGRVRETTPLVEAPVLAIGGVGPEHIAELVAAGAYGAAVLGGVWRTPDPVASAGGYLSALAAARDETE